MKLSLSWVKQYLKLEYSPEKIAEMLTIIGLEVEGIEKVESIRGGLKGVVLGKVVTCEKHPDADKLSVTTVDVGSEELLQIVCGAPNVAAEQKVVVATVGTTLYDKDGKEWSIKKSKIRGVESQGMLCAEDELGLGESHDGIIVLPENVEIGQEASTYFKVEDDYVFEVGLTPNRSDATSHLGMTRDLLAYLRVNEQYKEDLTEPDLFDYVTQRVSTNISVAVEDSKKCPRYTGITVNNVKVKPSPDWMQKLLRSVGVKPINNIVDITNYIQKELGQPLHAFDADKIDGQKVIIQTLPQGTEFVSLDGVTRKLQADDLMICDGKGRPLCMAGVYGGLDSGVTEETKNVFIESAHFNAKSTRKTSTFHNLRTDAAKVYEKGSDPNITEFAAKRAAALIRLFAEGEISNVIEDKYPHPIKNAEIRLYYQQINDLIGTDVDENDVHAILQAMDMEISPLDDESILVKVPTNKVDVTREVDLIEEIIRIFGLNRVAVPTKIQSTLSYSPSPNKYAIKEVMLEFLASNGMNEMMGLSLIESSYYKNQSWISEDSFVYINNTSNIHLDIMRPEMMVSGLLSVAYNINRKQQRIALFESGKSYQTSGDKWKEKEWLTIFISGNKGDEIWTSTPQSSVDFFDLKATVLGVLKRVGISQVNLSEQMEDERFLYGLTVTQNKNVIAKFGAVNKKVCQAAGIKTTVFYAEIDIEKVVKESAKSKNKVTEISRFPMVRRDLALVIDEKVSFAEVESIARATDKKILQQVGLFDIYSNEAQLGKGKKSYSVYYQFESVEKTLSDQEIDKVMQQLVSNYESKIGAIIRK